MCVQSWQMAPELKLQLRNEFAQLSGVALEAVELGTARLGRHPHEQGCCFMICGLIAVWLCSTVIDVVFSSPPDAPAIKVPAAVGAPHLHVWAAFRAPGTHPELLPAGGRGREAAGGSRHAADVRCAGTP